MLQMPSATNNNDDATSLLGTFLLQGWIMTDQLCSEASCSVPMMRSKDGMIQFCVLHDPLPTSNARNTDTTTPTGNNKCNQGTPTFTNVTTTTTSSDDTEDDESIVVIEHAKQQQQSSTTGDDDEFRIKQERREQSSKASQLIGQKMLQRWALLNDTCPNTTCYAIPLVRHPSNKSLYCVICEQSYQPEKAPSQQQQQQQQTTGISSSSNEQSTPPVTHTSTSTTMTHTPLGSPALDRSTKRQKKEDTVTSTIIDPISPPPILHEGTTAMTTRDAARVATETSVRRLTSKLALLTDRMDQCTDHKELIGLCQSLEACANALKACAATLETLGL